MVWWRQRWRASERRHKCNSISPCSIVEQRALITAAVTPVKTPCHFLKAILHEVARSFDKRMGLWSLTSRCVLLVGMIWDSLEGWKLRETSKVPCTGVYSLVPDQCQSSVFLPWVWTFILLSTASQLMRVRREPVIRQLLLFREWVASEWTLREWVSLRSTVNKLSFSYDTALIVKPL